METTAQLQLVVTITLNAWNAQNKQLNQLIDALTDEQLRNEIAPGRNTGIYLLGHLIAVSDALIPLLGFGERLYPDLDPVFIKTPDKSGLEMPSIATLKQQLQSVNAALTPHLQAASIETWLDRHMMVTPEDFAKELHRNKLNVLISRTNHMANHIGQMILLK